MEKQEQINKARKVLDWYEKHDLPLPDGISFYGAPVVYHYVIASEGRDLLTSYLKACLLDNIKVKKTYTDNAFTLAFDLDGDVRTRVSATRDMVCEAVPTGEKRLVKGSVIPDRWEPVIKWECKDSLLKSDDENDVE